MYEVGPFIYVKGIFYQNPNQGSKTALSCTLPGRAPPKAVNGKAGQGHSILGLGILNILASEIWKQHFKETPVTTDYKSMKCYSSYWNYCFKNGSHKLMTCFLIYYRYKVRKKPFIIKPSYYRVMLWVVPIFSRLGTTRKRLSLQRILNTSGVPKRKPQIDGLFLNELHI